MAREKGSGSFREIERGGKKLYEYRIEGKSFYAKIGFNSSNGTGVTSTFVP